MSYEHEERQGQIREMLKEIFETERKKRLREALVGLGWCLAYFALFPLLLAWEGFALVKLWGWFLAPLTGVTPSLPQAMGLSLIVALLVAQSPKKEPTTPEVIEQMKLVIRGMAWRPGIAIGIGWALQRWFL